MNAEGGPGNEQVRYLVAVSDLTAVQRLLGVLAGRRHAVTRFCAVRGADGRWDVTLECPVGAADAPLLRARLARPPSVLSVSTAP